MLNAQIVVWIKMIMFLDIPSDEMMSPTSKSSRSDSRTSFGSIFDSPMKDKSMERVRLVVVLNLWCLFLAYLTSFISQQILGWISAPKSRKLRVSGWHPEILPGWGIHRHAGHSLLLQLWPSSGTRRPIRTNQSSTLCTLGGHNLH